MQLTANLRRIVHEVRNRLLLANAATVARECDISQSNVFRIRQGGTPSLPTLELLCEYFDSGQLNRQPPE